MKKSLLLITLALMVAIPSSALAAPVGPGTSFQFRLTDGGQLYSGTCNVQLKLYDALTSGTLLGTSTHTSVSVANGEASVYPTWGDQWEGSQRWVEVAVQCGADAGYTTLSPRLEITATPYASYSLETPWSGVSGKPAACSAGYALVDFAGTCAQLTTGTASAAQVTYWSGAYALAGDVGLTYDAASDTLTSGNLTLSGTARRITGDMSNATLGSRAYFQTSTSNANTIIGAIPNGTATTSGVSIHNGSDPANSARYLFRITATSGDLDLGYNGTGSYLPMAFVVGGSQRVAINTSGGVQIGTSSAPASGYILRTAGGIQPNVTTTSDLGSASLRWNGLYTNDINASGVITASGDVVFDTAGGGLTYSDNYNSTNLTLTLTTQNTWYTNATTTTHASNSNNVLSTVGGLGFYATTTGNYLINATLNFTATASAKLKFTIINNGSASNCYGYRDVTATANEINNAALTCILPVSASNVFRVGVTRTDTNGGTIVFLPSQISAVLVGR